MKRGGAGARIAKMLNSIVAEDLQRIHRGVRREIARLRNSTVLVTGCAGFLGFYFMRYLATHADEIGIKKIIGLDSFLLKKPEWLGRLREQFPEKLEVRGFDISRDDLSAIDGAESAEFVIHMASIASPTFYRQYPVETLDANVWGLRRLLETYRRSGTLRGMLFFSSSEIYGDPDPGHIPTDEEYRGNAACNGPRACYDEAKRFGETLCYVFAKTYGLPVTIARPFNNYGPGMRPDDRRLPADFAQCVLDGRDIVILSDGSPTRTFCYASDAITGYLLCLLHGQFDYFNIGIEQPEISVRDLAKIYQAAGQKIFGYRG
ncbi:MAG: NAD-dependent epimerase/dehydratase family protein, partial [Candidatus Binataceae bacterium]